MPNCNFNKVALQFGMLCFLETPVLRFTLLPYYWRIIYLFYLSLLNALTTNAPLIETSLLICSTNKSCGFYMRGALVVKGLKFYLFVKFNAVEMGFIKGLSGVQDVHVYVALMCLSDVHVGVLWINFILLVSLHTVDFLYLYFHTCIHLTNVFKGYRNRDQWHFDFQFWRGQSWKQRTLS